MGQAKLRKNEIAAIKAANINGRRLVGAYWGYHPLATADTTSNLTNKPGVYTDDNRGGFEFSHLVLKAYGVPDSVAEEMIQCFYTGARAQVYQFTHRDPTLLLGKTAEEFLDLEQQRLDSVVAAIDAANRKISLKTLLEYAVIACGAISTLVAGGRLKQDNFNGDQFAWMEA